MKLKPPSNFVDVTEQYRGTVITLVGAEVFRKAMPGRDNQDRPTVNGFKEQKRNGVRAIVGYPTSTSDDEPQPS